MATFKPHGLHVAGPVCESLTDQETVLAEALLDVQHGLCPKAAIHPAQVKTIQRAYAVNKFDVAARQILGDGVPAVFAESGRMAEIRDAWPLGRGDFGSAGSVWDSGLAQEHCAAICRGAANRK